MCARSCPTRSCATDDSRPHRNRPADSGDAGRRSRRVATTPATVDDLVRPDRPRARRLLAARRLVRASAAPHSVGEIVSYEVFEPMSSQYPLGTRLSWPRHAEPRPARRAVYRWACALSRRCSRARRARRSAFRCGQRTMDRRGREPAARRIDLHPQQDLRTRDGRRVRILPALAPARRQPELHAGRLSHRALTGGEPEHDGIRADCPRPRRGPSLASRASRSCRT